MMPRILLVGMLEGGTGENDALATISRIVDEPGKCLEPGLAIFVGQRNPPTHLLDVRRWMVVVGVRNAGNSHLAWSSDPAKTWTWRGWRFEMSFSCPTFLNFGKDYAGARDGYVYIYSPDGDNAYRAADRMVLASVPKGPDHRTGSPRVLQESGRGRNSGLDRGHRRM